MRTGLRVRQVGIVLLAAGLCSLVTALPVAAQATGPGYRTPPPGGETFPRTDVLNQVLESPTPTPAVSPAVGSAGLPVTGGDFAGLAAIGAGFIVIGVSLRRRATRRAPPAAPVP